MPTVRDPRYPGLRSVVQSHAAMRGVSIEVGVQGGEVAEYAAFNEYGTQTIPPRPFMRTSLKRNRRRWSNLFAMAMSATTRRDDAGAIRALHFTGTTAVADTQETLRKGPWIPNADSTIARKGSSRPLVDTGQLVQSIRYRLTRVPG